MSEAQAVADVVVIGAGPAGLYAADAIQASGHSVVVLEGRDRIGGRLLSIPTAGGALDLGATWFWANEVHVNDVVATEGLVAFPQHLAGDAIFQNEQGAQRMQGNQVDAPSGRLVGGTQSIAHVLAARLGDGVVHLGTAVSSVVEAPAVPEMLAVTSVHEHVWHARQVIIAVPPATAVATIDFGNALSDRVFGLAAATPVWMGNIVKVVAQYEHGFWRDAGLAGAAFSYSGPMRELHDMSGPDGTPAAIFGFAQPGAGNPAPSEDEIVEQLTLLFGPDASRPASLHIHDWRSEPMTSPDNVDDLTNYQTFGHPLFAQPILNGRGHWASTETATTAPGHIEGAMQAATRAAQAVITSLSATV